jgi:hypothetical protein
MLEKDERDTLPDDTVEGKEYRLQEPRDFGKDSVDATNVLAE